MAKKLVWLAVLVVVAIIIFGVMGRDSSTGPIKIGLVAPMTGDTGFFGPQVKAAADYQLKKINDAAGDDGQKFELVYEDGKCAGSEAVNAFQKLTDIDGVKLVIGGICSSETLAMSPLANEKQIVLVSQASSNPKIEEEGPYTFSLSYSDSIVGEQLAKTAANGGKKIAIITEQNDFNIGIHDIFVEAMKSYPDVAIVSDETFSKGSSDFRGVLAKVKATTPDVLVLNPNPGTTAENLLKQLAEMKTWNGYKLYSQFAYLGDSSREAVGDFAEGMVIIDAPTVINPDFLAAVVAIEAEGVSTKDLGSYYTASTMDAVTLATTLAGQYENDPVKMQAALSTGSFTGFLGDIKFEGSNFVKFDKSGMYVVTEGKAVLQ